ncbi:MAG: trypsin-like peptidase domain-containing protein [Treponema sp.]|nr:trypsin-like peptidase domain-containing protein [Treponema sp.]
MKKHSKILPFMLIMAFITVCAGAQTVLSPEVVAKLSANVFEVVTLKSQDDPLTYDRPLPLERLPYAERTDKYESIGTAFLMEDGYLYTAEHVLQLQDKLHQDQFFVRDMEGNVYPVETIIKFATDRDFVIFTAKGLSLPPQGGLHFSRDIAVNSQIFAVGNAQGEGIIIRDGMFTSRTPEDQDGRWKWLRFSAAASPGNSGGPLVDKEGGVVGIITMKNQTENLNYALPISETDNSPDNTGVVNIEVYYRLQNIESQRFYKRYDFTVALPAPIAQVRAECWKKMQETTAEHAKGLYDRFCFTGPDSFVKTDRGNVIFTNSFIPSFPMFICLAGNNKWNPYYSDTETYQLDDNGYVEYTDEYLGMQMAYIRRPDSVSELELITNPKLYNDYMLEASPMRRAVGTEAVNIISYGEPTSSSTYMDNLGRQWLVSQWDVPWADVSVLAYALPLPEGIFIMSVYDEVKDIENGWNSDVPYLTDFCIPPYFGTVRQWNEYLSLPEDVYPRHKLLEDAQLAYSAEDFLMQFGKVDVELDPEIVQADDTEEDEFCIAYIYERDRKKGLKQTVSAVALATNENTNDYHYFQVMHVKQPPTGSSRQVRDKYRQMESQSSYYNGQPFTDGQTTNCYVIYNITENTLDFLSLELQGPNRIEDMEKYRDSVLDALGIKR